MSGMVLGPRGKNSVDKPLLSQSTPQVTKRFQSPHGLNPGGSSRLHCCGDSELPMGSAAHSGLPGVQ